MNNKISSKILDELEGFDTINLEELDSVSLLNRQDIKFIFHQDYLSPILAELKSIYNLLEINENQVYGYETTYYDTSEFIFFNQHKNGNKKRFKIRRRKYSSSSNIFFEIKIKNNKNKTIKERFLFNGNINDLDNQIKNTTFDIIGFSIDKIKSVLDVEYFRITMADKNLKERLTIDMGLNVSKGLISKSFDKLVIAEIKQDRYNPKSDFFKILRKYKIYKSGFSKYCMGIIHTNNDIKHNRFKPQLLRLNKILNKK